MGRPSNRDQRRQEILSAFARVMADHGYAGATVAAVAAEADITAGLIHHHFHSKDELLGAMLDQLVARFRERLRQANAATTVDKLEAYADAALKLDEQSDTLSAKCWVGVLAEGVRNPVLFRKIRRLIDAEIIGLQSLSGRRLDDQAASAVLAFVFGSLVLGAFAPKKARGFAAPALKKLMRALAR